MSIAPKHELKIFIVGKARDKNRETFDRLQFYTISNKIDCF
jgi:hypothetical protein